ncbi:hypothetical protein B0H10DRAFT_1973274 [Mycena sp. CBHHK59/15]|nr:hypothetical protein B0H10DRAFT_1973274 [Mycena sp. CBHHK59/15]
MVTAFFPMLSRSADRYGMECVGFCKILKCAVVSECPVSYILGGEPNSRSKPDFESMAVNPGSPYMCGSDNDHSSNHTNGNSNGIAVDAPDVRAVDAQPKDGKASLRVEPNTLPVRFAKRARSKSPKSPLRRLKKDGTYIPGGAEIQPGV